MSDNYTPSLVTNGRGKIYDTIADTVGDTPLVRLNKLAKDSGCVADIALKLEFFNPLASVKDRLAYGMIEAAELSGQINSNSVLVEATSGNTGIALAFICAAKAYPLILTMPESMSLERRKMLKFLGAKLELTPAAKGMKGAIARADDIVAENPNAILMQQFSNPANPAIHRSTTANEIWNDTQGQVDVIVTGVGTGGTITGCAQVIKAKKPEIKIVAIEPTSSPVLSGGEAGSHRIQGIGAGFVPDILVTDLIDEVIKIDDQEAFEIAQKVARTDGIPAGISSGATIAAALKIGQRPEMKGKLIVVIVASFAERYLSTDLFNFPD